MGNLGQVVQTGSWHDSSIPVIGMKADPFGPRFPPRLQPDDPFRSERKNVSSKDGQARNHPEKASPIGSRGPIIGAQFSPPIPAPRTRVTAITRCSTSGFEILSETETRRADRHLGRALHGLPVRQRDDRIGNVSPCMPAAGNGTDLRCSVAFGRFRDGDRATGVSGQTYDAAAGFSRFNRHSLPPRAAVSEVRRRDHIHQRA